MEEEKSIAMATVSKYKVSTFAVLLLFLMYMCVIKYSTVIVARKFNSLYLLLLCRIRI